MTANSRVRIHLLLLIAFNGLLFLPMIGHGFVLDDFMLMATLAFHPFSFGLTHAHGAFYTPLTWIWYKTDWLLWGMNAFPFALGDFVVYVANTLLLYRLALTLYQDESAAGWTALAPLNSATWRRQEAPAATSTSPSFMFFTAGSRRMLAMATETS